MAFEDMRLAGPRAKPLAAGLRFGRWTIVDGVPWLGQNEAVSFFKVICDCGEESMARANLLKAGRSTSCGCLRNELAATMCRTKLVDLTGQRFHSLTVISYAGSSRWNCLCDCGKQATPRGESLKSGVTRSCGCYRKVSAKATMAKRAYPNKLPPGMKKIRGAFNAQRSMAKKRGIPFLLSFEDWWDWWRIDNRWARRGRRREQLVMARYGDTGPYAIDNIHCISQRQNLQAVDRKVRSRACRTTVGAVMAAMQYKRMTC